MHMNEQGFARKQPEFPLWKGLVFGLTASVAVKVLKVWLPDPVSTGIGFFLGFAVMYLTPPRVDVPRNLLKALFWSAAAGLTAALGAFILGKSM